MTYAKVPRGELTSVMIDPKTISAIRFGYGLDPVGGLPSRPEDMVASVAVPDEAELRYPVAAGEARLRVLDRREELRLRKAGKTGDVERIVSQRRQDLHALREADVLAAFQRAVETRSPFRERLVEFWTDHFAVPREDPGSGALQTDYVEAAIRPHVAGSFHDLLTAATLHPAMVRFLNQRESYGPNSEQGRRRKKGLNENLARELLELHTLGVRGSYTQRDGRELAELLTGVTADYDGFRYDPRRAEPGQETVLSKRYGRDATIEPVKDVLEDLALHPETARHLSRKLIVHFLGGTPSEDWVEAMSMAYLSSGGQLLPLYAALLSDERAWSSTFTQVKRPFEFVVSAARGVGLSGMDLAALEQRDFKARFFRSGIPMGQPFRNPLGPDGWSEAPEAWITPAFLAARIKWAHAFVKTLQLEVDPRDFVELVLGDAASPLLKFAAANAERRSEGLVVVLASPEFNRR